MESEFATIRINKKIYALAQEMAKREHRTCANYMEVLILGASGMTISALPCPDDCTPVPVANFPIGAQS